MNCSLAKGSKVQFFIYSAILLKFETQHFHMLTRPLSLVKISLPLIVPSHPPPQTVETARAEAERIKRIGEAEAGAVESVGASEADRLSRKAAAFKLYGEAAVMAMVLETLPQVGEICILILD